MPEKKTQASEADRAEAKAVLDLMIVMDRLEKAYSIISDFEGIISEELVEKQGLMPLASAYEGLGSALGYIGSALDALHCGDAAPDGEPFRKLAITAPAARRRISEAYQACDLAQRNLRSDSSLNDPAAFLKSCLYAMLEKTYKSNGEAQTAINNILEICECGIETLDTIESVPEADCADNYMNSAGDTLHKRAPQLRELFESFRPKIEIDAKGDGDTT